MYYHSLFVLTVAAALLLGWLSTLETKAPTCRCRPWEPCWPTGRQWAAFNASIDDNLVRTRPVGYVCHEPTFDQIACDDLRRLTLDSGWRASQPGDLLRMLLNLMSA